MQSEKGGRHHKYHMHAIYGDAEIVITLDGEVLEGSIPNRQRKMLEGWMAIHEDELMANWKMLSVGEGYFKIEPLKYFESILRVANKKKEWFYRTDR